MSGSDRAAAPRPRFLADAMLGDVARWLRIMGEDCVYADPQWSDDVVLERATPEDRVLVTRDAQLVTRAKARSLRALLVPQTDTETILLQVYRSLGLHPEPERAATRCSLCNGLLAETDAEGAHERAVAQDKAPPRREVTDRHERFWSCSVCGQAYWRGTHWDEIEGTRRRVIERLALSG